MQRPRGRKEPDVCEGCTKDKVAGEMCGGRVVGGEGKPQFGLPCPTCRPRNPKDLVLRETVSHWRISAGM